MSKEMWISAQEELVEEYLEKHPNTTESEAYDAVIDQVDNRFADNFGDMIDRARDLFKDRMYGY